MARQEPGLCEGHFGVEEQTLVTIVEAIVQAGRAEGHNRVL